MNEIVKLRPTEHDDIEVFYLHQTDEEAHRIAGTVMRDRATYFERFTTADRDPSVIRRTILEGAEPAGLVAIFDRDGLTELCYWLGRDYWGRGIASRGVGLFLGEIPPKILHARIAKTNPASVGVVRRHGFEVVSEQVFVNAAGVSIEEYLMRRG